MPNGTSAPGKSSALLVVPMKGLTSDAGSLTKLAAGFVSEASSAAPADGAGTAIRTARAPAVTMPGTASRRRVSLRRR